MTLFGFVREKEMWKVFGVLNRKSCTATEDRARIKRTLDEFGKKITDLECKVGQLEGGKCHGRKKRN